MGILIAPSCCTETGFQSYWYFYLHQFANISKWFQVSFPYNSSFRIVSSPQNSISNFAQRSISCVPLRPYGRFNLILIPFIKQCLHSSLGHSLPAQPKPEFLQQQDHSKHSQFSVVLILAGRCWLPILASMYLQREIVVRWPPLWSSGQSFGYRFGGPGSIPGTTKKKK
jgi:hypothetical protein